MLCKCGSEMVFGPRWDDAQVTDNDHAFNVYLCNSCGMLCKVDVWADAGKRWIDVAGSFTFENLTRDP